MLTRSYTIKVSGDRGPAPRRDGEYPGGETLDDARREAADLAELCPRARVRIGKWEMNDLRFPDGRFVEMETTQEES